MRLVDKTVMSSILGKENEIRYIILIMLLFSYHTSPLTLAQSHLNHFLILPFLQQGQCLKDPLGVQHCLSLDTVVAAPFFCWLSFSREWLPFASLLL